MKQTGMVLAGCDLRPLTRFFLALCLTAIFPLAAFAAGPAKNPAQSTLLSATQGTQEEEGPCDQITLCPGQSYHDTLRYYVWDRNFTFTILSGPGTFTSEFKGDSIFGYFTLTPQTAGDYLTKFALVHYDTLNGQQSCDTLIARRHLCIEFNGQPVTLPDTCFAGHFCSAPCPRVLTLPCLNPGGGQLTFSKISGPGTIDTHTGKITYTANASGVYNFVIAVSNGCYADTASICDSITINKAPVLTCPEPQTFHTCKPDTVCTTLDVFDPELQNVTLTILSGNGYLNGSTLCVPVEGSGVYAVTVSATDSCGAADTCTFTVTVDGNRPPYVTSADDFSVSLCSAEQVCLTVNADDPDLDLASITTNFGTYNSQTHQVCFTADTAGVYTIITTATDSCGAWDSDTTKVTAIVNKAPVVSLGSDLQFTLCGVDTVCIPVPITDNNVSQVIPSEGIYNAQTGQLCFVADHTGRYKISVRVIDQCGAEDADTINVDFNQSAPPVLSVGNNDDTLTVCQGETSVCVPIETVPGAVVHSTLGTYNPQTHELCFNTSPDQRGYFFIVTAIDSCGAIAEDTAAVFIKYRTPHVQEGFVQDIHVCAGQPVCTTINTDLPFDSAVTSAGATFDPQTRQICFTPDHDGFYSASVTLFDSCGAFWIERVNASVTIGAPPELSVANDTVEICQGNSVCIPVQVSAGVSVQTNLGTYNPETHEICFVPEGAGQYTIIVTASDSCSAPVSDTAIITVHLKQVVSDSVSVTYTLCAPEQVCVPLPLAWGQVADSVNASLGNVSQDRSQLCFVPQAGGQYTSYVTYYQNGCGVAYLYKVKINVVLKHPPVIAGLRDTSLYLCYPTMICLPVSITDADNDIKTITVNRGQYKNGTVCFVPYGAGTYPIIVTVTDSCGAVVKDTANVVITTDQTVHIVWPHDTTVMVCDNNTFCFPVGAIPPGATVTVSGIGASWNAQTQSVCLTSQCAVKTKITVKVQTACNTFTGIFNVDVKCNDAPLVILPPDYTTGICASSQICVPVGISDADHNIKTITVTGGSYDAFSGRICFTADTMGTYRIFASATDSCGKYDADTLYIHVNQNTPPVLTPATLDTTITGCTVLQQVCIPISAYDGGQAVTVTSSLGTYNATSGSICFTPPNGAGTYQLTVIAKDVCGAADTSLITVHVQTTPPADIQCPTGAVSVAPLCAPGQVCVPLVITGAVSVTPSRGSWSNNQLCFTADSSGTYQIRVIATGVCNSDTCNIIVPVVIQPTAEVTCPGNSTVFLCTPDTICYDITKSASVTSLSVTAPAYVSGSQVCVPLLQTGVYTIRVIGTGQCGADTCTFTVNATVNKPPVVNAGHDTTITLCALQQICLPISYSDPDNKITQLISSIGQITGNQVCFTPSMFGMYTLVIRATDSCGVFKSDTAYINVVQGATADITCPGTQFFTICGVDTVCVNLPITPANAQVTVSRGTYSAGHLCIPVSTSESFSVRVIASAPCGADTCNFTVNVDKANAPNITCPGSIDTTLCLVTPDTFCIPVTVTGTGVTVTVLPAGYYSGGYVCVPVTAAGSKSIKIIGTNMCGADTCTTQLNVLADAPPTLTVPADFSVERCPDDTTSICIGGIFAHDARSVATLTKTCGSGTLSLIRPDSGGLCFRPDGFGPYQFCITASDGCNSVVKLFTVTVNEKENCDLCAQVWLESGTCTPVGLTKGVDVMVATNDQIGGFDLLLKFDASTLIFQTASIADGAIDGWEYFTYRLNSASCNGPCPNGLIRFIGIADANNGAHHPPASTLLPNGRLIHLQFLVANDQNLGDQFLPISFIWYDCGDNTFSNLSGSILFAEKRIYNNEGILIWDEDDNVHYPEGSRPPNTGARDICLDDSAKTVPSRCVEFGNGGICVIHPDSIDARGDLNLNDVAFEIADAVLYSNYFVRGLGVFTINIAGQVAASDVNRDGLTLTVSDLVLLIRIITGDAPPTPKINPNGPSMSLASTLDNGTMTVASDAPGNIGAMRLVYNIKGNMTVGVPQLAPDAQNMDMIWSIEDGQLRILISKIEKTSIESGKHSLVDIPITGDGELELVTTEIVDYEGQPYSVARVGVNVPTKFALSQNYPNPFNPTTTISFALPVASEWKLKIYNVTGALVREFSGTSQAGEQKVVWDAHASDGSQSASGVYFYRLEAGSFTASKKMVFIK